VRDAEVDPGDLSVLWSGTAGRHSAHEANIP
jgi:hypothetical protein